MEYKPAIPTLLASAALFGILFQFRLFANDVADTWVFILTISGAFVAAYLLFWKKITPVVALPILAAFPWVIRFLIAAPRIFSLNHPAVLLDSTLLSWDRNIFVSLFPFYWAAFSTYGSLRNRYFLRGSIIAADLLIIATFSALSPLSSYRWPVVLVVVVAGVLFLQILSFIFSLPPEYRIRTREKCAAGILSAALIIFAAVFFLPVLQKQLTNQGGGLLEPQLFTFDFSQILKLDPEIKLPESDLALIVKKDSEDYFHVLIRRSVLSNYSPSQGFFRNDELDEKSHPLYVPQSKQIRKLPENRDYEKIDQEYFLVNIDASALIGMSEPGVVTPYKQWDASSFRGAYAVESYVQNVDVEEYFGYSLDENRVRASAGDQLSDAEKAVYTEYGQDERIRTLAEVITTGARTDWRKVEAIYRYLKYGEYRYSLKPGIAPDGDQLAYFLFQAKKGYCTYFAFSMTLLIRSLGIPARVASGFFIDPEAGAFNYYPVQSNQAHAWTEVFMPGYGWVECDPTTNQLAAGEEFSASRGGDRERFGKLMQEILENHSLLEEMEENPEELEENLPNKWIADTIRNLKQYWPVILGIAIGLIVLIRRFRFLIAAHLSRNPRKKVRFLWLYVRSRVKNAGYPRVPPCPESAFAKQMDSRFKGLYELYHDYAAARFAPEYSSAQSTESFARYRDFSATFPKKKFPWRAALFIFIIFSFGSGDSVQAQRDPDSLYREAVQAEEAQYWERAVELYSEGEKNFPSDYRFFQALGELYRGRNLYKLAWDHLRQAEKVSPNDNGYLLENLARTAGALNLNEEAAGYWERILYTNPNSTDVISTLGWVYFKLHRLEAGEQLLRDALDRLGNDAGIAMTLGTVYADMFRFNESKRWYVESIAMADAMHDNNFSAIAHYNLSILESRFGHFTASQDRVRASLRSRDRTSGHLMAGELDLRQLNFPETFREYQRAYELDDTSPLPAVSLAEAYQIAGRLEEARLYAEDALAADDYSWMMDHGIDPDSYKRNLHEILYETYRGKAAVERQTPHGSVREWFWGLLRGFSYQFKASVHQKLYYKYTLAAARAYNDDTNPDVLREYCDAFEAYPDRALSYLQTAATFELPLIPESYAWYRCREGEIRKDPTILSEAISLGDPLWERDNSADAYKILAHIAKKPEAGRAAQQLYRLNPGALQQAGIKLPVNVRIAYSPTLSSAEKKIRRMLKATSFRPDETSIFTLEIVINASESGFTTHCELFDNAMSLFSCTIPVSSTSQADLSGFVRNLADNVFNR
ncbi:transglutaminase [Spirochaetia bacterium]|nr:transglutaminase [Spirochaetia bacterium]GHU29951.1 transglutaminase [Spirochaetia bacterium]